MLAREIEKRTGFETRTVVLGHIQRGGSPSAFDRVLATRYGMGAIDAIHRGDFGVMMALQGTQIVAVPLTEEILRTRLVDQDLLEVALGLQEKLEKEPVS